MEGPAADKTVIIRRRTKKVALPEPTKVASVFYFTDDRVPWRIGQSTPKQFAATLASKNFLNRELKRTQVAILFQFNNFEQEKGTMTQFIRMTFTSRTGFTLPRLLNCIYDVGKATAVVAIKEQFGHKDVNWGQVREYLSNRVVPMLYVNESKGVVYVPVTVVSRRQGGSS